MRMMNEFNDGENNEKRIHNMKVNELIYINLPSDYH